MWDREYSDYPGEGISRGNRRESDGNQVEMKETFGWGIEHHNYKRPKVQALRSLAALLGFKEKGAEDE